MTTTTIEDSVEMSGLSPMSIGQRVGLWQIGHYGPGSDDWLLDCHRPQCEKT